MNKANLENKNWYEEIFDKFERSLNGQSQTQLHQFRKTAFEQFINEGFPTTELEEWKFTNIGPVNKINFIASAVADKVEITRSDVDKNLFTEKDASIIVVVNGLVDRELSSVKPELKIEFANLHEAGLNESSFKEKYLKNDFVNKDGMTYLNSAFLNDGLFLKVQDNLSIDSTVYILFLNGSKNENLLVQPRNIYSIGKNSRLKLIEVYASLDPNAYLYNGITEIHLEENSNLEFDRVQDEDDSVFHINRTQVFQKRNSVFTSSVISIGGEITRNDLNSALIEENSECHLYGLYLADGKRMIDNHSLIDHAVPHCHSNELYKGILDEESKGIFNGKVIVRKDAQKTLAYQSNKNLLLSTKAKINTKPQLEIFADDVKCSHGATVGQLDEQSLFYLQSRGISKTVAKSILIKAFASDVLDNVNDETLKEKLNKHILERLH
ncbi:MAG: Fe-S cluster assembly protein SufD [Ignavibacteriales bacterium]|nr:MAG: Fe-S cluster assembly protein SufD [Ignavibacteriales bacterium]